MCVKRFYIIFMSCSNDQKQHLVVSILLYIFFHMFPSGALHVYTITDCNMFIRLQYWLALLELRVINCKPSCLHTVEVIDECVYGRYFN